MYDQDFTNKIVGHLEGLCSIEDRPRIVAEFYFPIFETYTLGIEPNGIVDFKKQETGSRKTLRRKLTDEHITAFKEDLVERLVVYQRTVEHNKHVCRFYETPTFGLDDAVTMAQDALLESFKGVRESYRK